MDGVSLLSDAVFCAADSHSKRNAKELSHF